MRTPEEIRRQLEHFRGSCGSEAEVRQTWAAALEWVLADEAEEPAINAALTPFAKLVTSAIAARHALRSYQHGNSSTELAAEIADDLDTAIRQALEHRDLDLRNFSRTLSELQVLVEGIRVKFE